MEDFLAAILSGLFELFAEVILQLLIEAICSLFARIFRGVAEGAEAGSPVFAAAGYLVLGVMAGFASFLVLPHHLVRPSRFHRCAIRQAGSLAARGKDYRVSSLYCW